MAKDRKHLIEFNDMMLINGSKLSAEEKLCSYKGVLYPVTICRLETLQALDTFEARQDDVIITGYPKCGTHWLGYILNNMSVMAEKYTEEEKKRRIELEKELEITPRLEFGDPGKFKILVLIRNPKDTLVSFFHFNNKVPTFPPKTWDEFFTDFMSGKVSWGSYFDFIKDWDKYIDDENVTSVSYEELKENPNLGIKRIATFFGFSLTEDEIQNIAEKSSFKTMKQNGQEILGTFGDLLFRKGSVGDWKTLLSEYQNQEMDRKFEEHLAGTKLGARIKYDIYCKT